MKKILAWPAPLLQKWLLSLLLCLPFLAAAIISAFSGDRTFLILSALLLLFCGVRCAELYVMLANERYRAEDGVCLAVSSIPFQHQRRVTLQRADGNHIVFCVEKNKRLSVGQAYPAAQLLLRRGHSRNLWALRPKKKSGRNLSCGHGNSTGNRKSLTIRVQVGILRTLRLSCHKRYAQISITSQLYHKILWLSRKGQLTATWKSIPSGDIHTPEAVQKTAATGAGSQHAPTGLPFLWNVRFLSAGAHPAQCPPA